MAKKRGIIAKALGVGKQKTGIIKGKKNAAQLKREKQAKAKKDTAARDKKVAKAKANIGKKGYDKYGTPSVETKKKNQQQARVDKRVAETTARNKAIDDRQKAKNDAKNDARAKAGKQTTVAPKAKGAMQVKTQGPTTSKGKTETKKESKKLSDIKIDKAPTLVGRGKSDNKKTSSAQKRAGKKKSRRDVKAAKLKAKAAQYKEGDKKGERLKRRAKRQEDIGSGRRKTALGTALKGAAQGYLTGSVAGASRKGKTSRKAADARDARVAAKKKSGFDTFTKPNAAKFKPLGGKFKALSLSESDRKKDK